MADPEFPTEDAEKLADVLTSSVSDRVEWQVRAKMRQLPLNGDGQIVVWETADRLIDDEGWDYMVCLTELSRRVDHRVIVSDVNRTRRAALISLPALGPIRSVRHARSAVIRVVRVLLGPDLQPERSTGGGRAMRRLSGHDRSPLRQESTDGRGDAISYLPLRGRPRRNTPAGGHGADQPALSPRSQPFRRVRRRVRRGLRHFLLQHLEPGRFFDTTALVGYQRRLRRGDGRLADWLQRHVGKIRHGRRSGGLGDEQLSDHRHPGHRSRLFYLLLFTLALLTTLAIIPGDYMQTVLGQPDTVLHYGALAWLATSMGTIAAALGSSFESDSAIRNATYGRRELERYEVTHHDDE